MNDERLASLLTLALTAAAGKVNETEAFRDADALGKWRMVADQVVRNTELDFRARLPGIAELTRTPGFREANDEVWKATGKVVTLHVDNKTRFLESVSLDPQPQRDVDSPEPEPPGVDL